MNLNLPFVCFVCFVVNPLRAQPLNREPLNLLNLLSP